MKGRDFSKKKKGITDYAWVTISDWEIKTKRRQSWEFGERYS
jgi:hypothetical protein